MISDLHDPQDLELRIWELERQNRRLKLLGVGALLLPMLILLMGQASPQKVGNAPAQAQERKTTMSQQGRILGIGGIFFKSANQPQMKEWYAKHLGLADSGQGAMLPWREKDNPESEQMTIWSIFAGNTRYFEPSPASFMVNYIVDDLDALLGRLAKEGVQIDPKRQDASYGRFAWIYDPDGNKIELWQPLHPGK